MVSTSPTFSRRLALWFFSRLTRTRPETASSCAAVRVLARRANQSHLSMRRRSSAVTPAGPYPSRFCASSWALSAASAAKGDSGSACFWRSGRSCRCGRSCRSGRGGRSRADDPGRRGADRGAAAGPSGRRSGRSARRASFRRSCRGGRESPASRRRRLSPPAGAPPAGRRRAAPVALVGPAAGAMRPPDLDEGGLGRRLRGRRVTGRRRPRRPPARIGASASAVASATTAIGVGLGAGDRRRRRLGGCGVASSARRFDLGLRRLRRGLHGVDRIRRLVGGSASSRFGSPAVVFRRRRVGRRRRLRRAVPVGRSPAGDRGCGGGAGRRSMR